MSNVLEFPGLGLSIPVNPVAFTIGGLTVRWYGIIIAVGMVVGILLAYHFSKKAGITEDDILDVGLLAVIFGVIGARIYYVVFAWDEFSADPMKIFRVWEGGLAIYGGIIAGLITALVVCKKKKIPLRPVTDVMVIGVIAGQAIGRWGNFMNHEAFGSNTTLPWGMTSERIQAYLTRNQAALAAQGITVDPSVPVHPCFLYESLWCFLGLALLIVLFKHRRFDGETAVAYIGWYGFGRGVIEGLRTDSLMWGPVRVSQVLGFACAVVALGLIIYARIRIKKKREQNIPVLLYVQTEQSKQRLQEAKQKQQALKKKKADKKERNHGSAD